MRNTFMPFDALKYSKKNGRIAPFFMKNDDEFVKKLTEALRYYDSMAGKRMADFDAKRLAEFMDDMKLGRSVCEVMRHFYVFKSFDFSEIFSPDELKILSGKGIGSAEDLRVELFEYLNRECGGFAPPAVRSKVIVDFASLMGVKQDIERALWIDREDEKVLKKLEEPKVSEIIDLYNMCVAGTLFMNSGKISIMLPEMGGSELRKIFLACKYSGVLCDISQDYGKYVLDISGPFEIFGRPEKYGHSLCIAAFRIFGILDRCGREYSFCSEVFIKNRKYVFSMNSSDMIEAGLAKRKVDQGVGQRPEFDSASEELFYGFFGTGKHSWDVEREPEPIIANDFVYVPDFAYVRGKSKVYVEIMGYFTEHYHKKKIEKLRRLHGMNIQMIIIANGGYEDAVRKEIESVGYPVAYFEGKDMPYGTVLRILEERFSDFSERLKVNESEKEEITADVEKELASAGFIPEQVLSEKLKCYNHDEFEKCRNIVISNVRGIYVSGAGFFTAAKLDELKAITDEAHLEKKGRECIEKRFSDIGVGTVDTVIAHLGYAVRWRGLLETEIVKK